LYNKLQFVDGLNKGDAGRDGESNKLKFVGRLAGKIIVDAKTGSSGSGAKSAANTHHPQRMNSFYAYKPFVHQHVPEIQQHLKEVGEFSNEFVFMTHSLPVSRGIFASCYLEVDEEISTAELRDIFENFYHPSISKGGSPRVSKGANLDSEREVFENQVFEDSELRDSPLLARGLLPTESPFVRLVENSPDINWVKNTNFCDIAVHANGKQIVVFSAIDNLVKGAAGQAVQNMNLMFGLDETTGLIFTGSNP
jgi:N-acetyl-gamma-glutamyl-phosphate reductase